MDTIILILTKYGLYGVFVAAFFEAIIFPPPVDIVLIPVMIANRDKAILYSILTVLISMLGATVGYSLGKKAGMPFLKILLKPQSIDSVKRIYDKYGATAIITSAFTPIPYEVYTLSAGLFRMNFRSFLYAALVGRILRYVPQGIFIQLSGTVLENSTIESIGFVIVVFFALIIFYIIIKKYVSKKNSI